MYVKNANVCLYTFIKLLMNHYIYSVLSLPLHQIIIK